MAALCPSTAQARKVIAATPVVDGDEVFRKCDLKDVTAESPGTIATPVAKKAKKAANPTQNSVSVRTSAIVVGTPKEPVVSSSTEEQDFYNELDKLQSYGINMADINKFKAAGFCTVLSIIQATKKELCNVKGISEARAEKIIEAATKIEVATNFLTGSQLLKKRQQVLRMTSGSCQLDNLLGGGFESMSITEIFGENRTGKTQLCHTLCVTAQLPLEMRGGNGKVCFIDTEGTFRPEKIHKISARFGLDGEAVLENIIYARAYTHEHMSQLLSLAAGKMIEDHFSLLIIDSIMALFRVDFSGRGELSERQQMLGKMLSKLMKIAEQFNIGILLTNHVMSDPGAGLTFVPNPTKPIGGHVLGHASTTRLSLRKGKGDQRVCKVYDSPCLPEGECVFQISDAGVIDALE